MKFKITVLIICSWFLAQGQNTFYVGTNGDDTNNPGSNALPFATITHGVNQLDPGDVLIVKTGTYSEIVVIDGNLTGGDATGDITVLGQANAIIDGSSLIPSGNQGLLNIIDAQFVTFENMTLRNFSTTVGTNITDTPMGIYIHGSSHDITIKDNIIHDIKNLSTCNQNDNSCYPGANGIGVFGDSVFGMQDLTFTNNEVYNCVLGSSEAFVLNGNIDRFTLEGNYVHDNNNIGFDFIGYEGTCDLCTDENDRVRNGLVTGNTAVNNSTTLFGGNPWYGNDGESAGGFYVDGGRNIVFDGNYSSGNDIGFEFASEYPMKSTSDILMINNYIYNNIFSGLNIGGYAASNSGGGGGNADGIYIHNNSFYNNKGWGTEIVFAYRVFNTEIHNNIFFGEASVEENFEFVSNEDYSTVNWGKNIWWGSSTSGQSNLPGTKIIMNPQFTNPASGDLDLLSSSPAIDQGILQSNLAGWTSIYWGGTVDAHGSVDINNTARLVSSIDIGADEFGNSSNCPNDYAQANNNELNGNQTTSFVFETDGILDSNQSISGAISVDYDSKIAVSLLSGFEVSIPSIFHAYIDGCN